MTTMIASLALVLQMEHDLTDELQDYTSKLEQYYIPCYSNTTCDTFLHILQFLHFVDNSKKNWPR
jgi:hypothetical protein